MQLRIETFDNRRGGNAFYKAVTHPVVAPRAAVLLARLAAGGKVAVYDPLGFAAGFAEFHDLRALDLAGVYVQDVDAVGHETLGLAAEPVTALPGSKARAILVAAFDAGRLVDHVRHLVPEGAELLTLDEMRLPDEFVTNRRNYLDPLNFATNFVFFRDAGLLRTRLVTTNYWAGYGAGEVVLYFRLFDGAGTMLAEWRESPGKGAFTVDSAEIRRRFGLPEFAGQLFVHAVGAAGHDVVKYALDTWGEGGDPSLSCTHDANSWPADFYAGLPAPDAGERVTLWVQNSHPVPVPPRSIGLNLMGQEATAWIEGEIAPFASAGIDVASLLPAARWPQQLELQAGKWVVRPRYEIVRERRRRIAHVNVERTDLAPEPRIAELGKLMGKGFLLPAPVLPTGDWRTILQPTPMARGQRDLPIAAIVYDGGGTEVARHFLGRLDRAESIALDLDALAGGAALPSGHGHVELVYDFRDGGGADGWLHALFRYEHRESGHRAETSFGAHMFNTALIWRNEPQSYAGRPPGLSTRLFLRLGEAPLDTFCHLVYPVSATWHTASATDFILYDGDGAEVARRSVAIARSGSIFWRYGAAFDAATRRRAGNGAYVVIRDTTCRLFGYHGLIGNDGAFSLDHMFGF